VSISSTSGVNFINIRCQFHQHQVSISSTSGVNFINVLLIAFTLCDPKSIKIYCWHNWFFTLSGSVGAKAVRWTLIKLSPAVFYQKVLFEAFELCSLCLCLLALPSLTKNLLLKCWWNWLKVTICNFFMSPSLFNKFHQKNLLRNNIVLFQIENKSI